MKKINGTKFPKEEFVHAMRREKKELEFVSDRVTTHDQKKREEWGEGGKEEAEG